MDAFTRDLGKEQGRIASARITAPSGTFVFCLGFETPAHFETLNIGDYTEVSQTATFQAGTRIMRSKVLIRPPALPSVGARWRVSMRIDGSEVVSKILVPGDTTRTRDFAANVSKLAPGDHAVAFRLSLEAA